MTGMNESKLKKSLIQMRMELHRQEIRHEILLATQPLQKIGQVRQYWSKAKPWIGLAGIVTPMLVSALRVRSNRQSRQQEKM